MPSLLCSSSFCTLQPIHRSVKDRQSKEVAREEARQKAAARAALAEREGREDEGDESDEDEEDEEAAGGDDGVAAYEKAPRYVDKVCMWCCAGRDG